MVDGSVRGIAHDEENDSEFDDVYMAIGNYITRFSEVIHLMRQQIADYLAPASERFRTPVSPLLDALFDKMTAGPVVESYFAMSSQAANLDRDDTQIRSTLRKLMVAQVEFRNQIAHADWHVGWRYADTKEAIPFTVRKTKSSGLGYPVLTDLDLTPASICAEVCALQELFHTVMLFGSVCRMRQRGVEAKLTEVLEVVRDGSATVRERENWEERYNSWVTS
ncbi:hypothetical protein B7C42_07643 [Nocardia cerradoensis]|uniref:Uncharacterized protein n=2 Tax=Nocardia cerradoensis TaxID=85688 RepID=A0A231GUT7_9NOCA|nr:hypothetical protein B7C42_07643 [Nocardia cerradoensis]